MRSVTSRVFGRWLHGSISCREVGRLVQTYLDGHLDDERSRCIEIHLDECLACGLDAETYREIKSTLAASASDVPDDAIRRLQQFAATLARGDDPPDR